MTGTFVLLDSLPFRLLACYKDPADMGACHCPTLYDHELKVTGI